MASKPGKSEEEREKWGLLLKFWYENIQDSKPDGAPEMDEKLYKGKQFPFHGLICQSLPFLSGLFRVVFCKDRTDYSKEPSYLSQIFIFVDQSVLMYVFLLMFVGCWFD